MAITTEPGTKEYSASSRSREEERALLQRVLATPSFARSAFLTNFLTYVCDRKFEGREEEITEYQIGIQALGRPAAYHTGEDNIVRNYARILRRRLDEYFAAEGLLEPLRIVIPRGHYVPVFEPNHVTAASPVPSEPAPPAPGIIEARPSPFRWWWLIAFLSGAAVVLFVVHQFRAPDPYAQFWGELASPGRSTFVIPADSGVAMLQDITGKEIHLHDYVTGDMQNRFASLNLSEPGNSGPFSADRFANYTSTADLSIVVSLMRLPEFASDRVKVRYARDIRMDDLKQSNAVIIGGPHANPWGELFEPESNFKMQFPMHLNGVHLDERSILNKHPRNGEQATYVNMATDTSHETYTLISFLPSLDNIGYALLMQGQNMAGTQAAGDFLTDRSAMMPILKKAHSSDGTIGPFEILLETRTVGASAPEAHVIVERYGLGR
jgi:hypothetical protein